MRGLPIPNRAGYTQSAMLAGTDGEGPHASVLRTWGLLLQEERIMSEVIIEQSQRMRRYRWVGRVLGVGAALLPVAALAATGGPFGSISNFFDQVFMPAVGSIGIAGGIGYGAIHLFKHDYGKGTVGIATAAGGGFIIHQYGWFGQQAGISAAVIGSHAGLLTTLAHGLGL